MLSKLADADLISLIRSKSRQGAEALYDQYSRALFLAIIRIAPQKEIAETLLEQTYIKVWNSFDLYKTEECTILCWMMHIARNLAFEIQHHCITQPKTESMWLRPKSIRGSVISLSKI